MPLSLQGQRWQAHLDQLFPHGVMVSWDGEVRERWYPAARIVVQETDGLDPVIRIPVFSMDKLVGPYLLLSLDKAAEYHGDSWAARLAGAPKALILKADVPARIAAEMQPLRSQLISQDEEDPGEGSGPPQ